MGIDGASNFSVAKMGVQARIRELAPHALLVHCHCHLLQLAVVQAVYTLSTLWQYIHYSQTRTEYLKEVQCVLEPPEYEAGKPSSTHSVKGAIKL